MMSKLLSENTNEVLPFGRFGLSEDEFQQLLLFHYNTDSQGPQIRSCNEMPFFDWEAALLKSFFEANSDNEPLCSLVSAMMQCVKIDYLQRRADKAIHLVPPK
jgi:hypothetical protein